MSYPDNIDQLYITYPTILVYVNELTPYPGNYQNHPTEQVKGLADSLATFQQFKPIVVWRCAKSETLADGLQLHEGLLYIICGHGLWQGSMEAGVDRLEAKDISGVSREMAEAILVADNASVLGSEPIPDKLAALLARTREMTADRPGLGAMLERLKLRAGMNGQAIDPMAEWQGMPEFEQEDKTAFQSIHVHFKNQEDVNYFAELIGQKITEYTRFLWYPEIEIERYADKRYISEP